MGMEKKDKVNLFVWMLYLFAAFVCYRNLLSGPLLFDDRQIIAGHKKLFSVNPFHNWWLEPRPLRYVSLVLDQALFGKNYGLYHIQNIVFHLANGFLFYRLLLKLHVKYITALIAAGLFLFNPICVECIGIISHRKDLIMVFFVLIGLHICLKPSRVKYAILVLLIFAAILSKETAVVFPGLVVLVLLAKNQGDFRGFLGKHKTILCLVFVTTPLAFYAYLSADYISSTTRMLPSSFKFATTVVQPGDPLLMVVLTSFSSFLKYIAYMLLPLPSYIDHPAGWIKGLSELKAWLVLIGMAAYMSVAYILLKRRAFIHAAAWIWIFVSLSLFLFPYVLYQKNVFMFAERYAYLALIGGAWFIALILSGRLKIIAIGLIVLMYAASVYSVSHYNSVEKFWERTLKHHPNSSFANNSLGAMHMRNGEYVKAENYFRKSPDGLNSNLIILSIQSEDIAEGISVLEKLEARGPLVKAHLLQYHNLLVKAGDKEKAAEIEQRIFKRYTNDVSMLNGLAYSYIAGKEIPKALNLFKTSLQEKERNVEALYGLAQIAIEQKDYRLGLKYFDKISRFEMLGPAMLIDYSLCLAKLKDFKSAEMQLQIYIDHEDDKDEALELLSNIYFSQGKLNKALVTAEQISPDFEHYLESLDSQARILCLTGKFDEALKIYTEIRAKQEGESTALLQNIRMLELLPQVVFEDKVVVLLGCGTQTVNNIEADFYDLRKPEESIEKTQQKLMAAIHNLGASHCIFNIYPTGNKDPASCFSELIELCRITKLMGLKVSVLPDENSRDSWKLRLENLNQAMGDQIK